MTALPRLVPILALVLGAITAGCSSDPAFKDPDAVVTAFVATTSAPERSAHFASSGQMKTSMFEMGFESTFDAAGADFVGHSQFAAPALGDLGNFEVAVASMQGVGLVSYWGSDWSVESVQGANPFAGASRANVTIVGTERRDGVEVLHVKLANAEALLGIAALVADQQLRGAGNLSGTEDVFLLGTGVPVAASASMEGTFAFSEVTGGGSFQLEIATTVSGWDSDLEISAPVGVTVFPPATTFVADNGFDEAVIYRDASGLELLVPACERAISETFDGTEYSVRFASDGDAIMSAEPTKAGPERYSFVAAFTASSDQHLPVLQPTEWPCTGRNG